MSLALLLLGLTLGYAPQQAGSAPLSPALEIRVQALGKQLRCAVCQGGAIADSPASMARAQLDRVRELVAQGSTDEQVRSYFVERYGEWVLLEPPPHGINWIVWLAPGALLLGGFALVLAQLRRAPRATSLPSPPAATPGAPPDAFRDAIRSELER